MQRFLHPVLNRPDLKGRLLLILVASCCFLGEEAARGMEAKAQEKVSKPSSNIIGMYLLQHWPYHHPYAARTWSLEDWRGYAGGLKLLGYNTLLIWPMLETMPDPLTPSDQASLAKIAQVIEMLPHELQMCVDLVLCPNVAANNPAPYQPVVET